MTDGTQLTTYGDHHVRRGRQLARSSAQRGDRRRGPDSITAQTQSMAPPLPFQAQGCCKLPNARNCVVRARPDSGRYAVNTHGLCRNRRCGLRRRRQHRPRASQVSSPVPAVDRARASACSWLGLFRPCEERFVGGGRALFLRVLPRRHLASAGVDGAAVRVARKAAAPRVEGDIVPRREQARTAGFCRNGVASPAPPARLGGGRAKSSFAAGSLVANGRGGPRVVRSPPRLLTRGLTRRAPALKNALWPPTSAVLGGRRPAASCRCFLRGAGFDGDARNDFVKRRHCCRDGLCPT